MEEKSINKDMQQISEKSFLYRLAGKIIKILREYQKGRNKESQRIDQLNWKKLFKNKDNFLFELERSVKIKLYNDSILSRLIYNGFEKRERDYVSSVLNEGDIFVDIGCNVGLFSLIASKKVGESGKVICFEPTPRTFQRLLDNITLNQFVNLDVRNLGLSNNLGKLKFYVYGEGHEAWNSFARDKNLTSSNIISVPVSTLDHELVDIDKGRIKMVKIDVEGWEKFVLLGGQEFFIHYNPILIVEFTDLNSFYAGYGVHELFDIVADWGYTWFRLGENNQLFKETKQFRYPYDNLIAIKS